MVSISISESHKGLLRDRLRVISRSIANLEKTVMTPVGETARALVTLGIRKGVDPYGRRHPDPMFRKGLPLRDTGGLSQSVSHRVAGYTVRITIGKKYASYLQSGTGIYGPRKRKIRPVTAGALSWKPRGGQRVAFASVKGMKRRMLVPDVGLSDEWHDKIEKAIIRAVRRSLA